VTLTISEIRLSVVRLDLVHEFETSSHRKAALEHIIVQVSTGDGLTGWGECASPSDPYYCGETTESCWLILRDYLGRSVLGKPWETPSDAIAMMSSVSGNNFARAGLEMACWDLFARASGAPLAEVLGGTAETVTAGVSLGIENSIDELLTQVDKHIADGYGRIKLKVRPGWDLEPTRQVRAAFPGVQLQVDANTAYGMSDIDHLRRFDDFDLLMIEQPFDDDDLLSHVALKAAIDTPVCLDESITSLAVLRTAIRLNACSIVNIKVSRLGGLAAARDVHDACFALGIPVWCGGMHEFGVGRAANLAIASLPGFVLPSDVSGSDKYYARDIVSPPIRATLGRVEVPRASPGIGLEVDEEMLRLSTRRTESLFQTSGAPVSGQ
jgi:O-succinylbenzoate synthase